MSPACVTGSLRSPRWASVSLLPIEPIHTFIFSSIECQTRSKHQGDSEPHPRPWEASSLASDELCGKKAGGKLLFAVRVGGLASLCVCLGRCSEEGDKEQKRGERSPDLGSPRSQRPGDFQSHCCQEKVSQVPLAHQRSLSAGPPVADTPTLSSPRRSLPSQGSFRTTAGSPRARREQPAVASAAKGGGC